MANIGQIEGLDFNDNNNNKNNNQVQLDNNNWKQWNSNQVNEWIRLVLKDSMIEDDKIDQFMSDIFVKMEISGKILMILKTNDEFWLNFKTKVENYSFGIFVAIGNAIRSLPN